MRRAIVPQMQLGELTIADIKLDPKSRDDIPQILRGLQHLCTTPELRGPIFAILEEVLPKKSSLSQADKARESEPMREARAQSPKRQPVPINNIVAGFLFLIAISFSSCKY